MEKLGEGQAIIARGTTMYNKGKIKEFFVLKIGRKYVYVVEHQNDSLDFAVPLYKDTLGCCDLNFGWRFFRSQKEMEEFDEMHALFDEISKKITSPNTSAKSIGLEKLRKIGEILLP